MTQTIPKYVEICHPKLDLIERGVPLEEGSIHPVVNLHRLGIKTLERRLKDGWLIGRTEEDFENWRQGKPAAQPEPAVEEVVEEDSNEGVEEDLEPAPEYEPPPPPPTPKKTKKKSNPSLANAKGVPTRDGKTIEEYWKAHVVDPKAKRVVAKCPKCDTIKRAKRKLFECCATA